MQRSIIRLFKKPQTLLGLGFVAIIYGVRYYYRSNLEHNNMKLLESKLNKDCWISHVKSCQFEYLFQQCKEYMNRSEYMYCIINRQFFMVLKKLPFTATRDQYNYTGSKLYADEIEVVKIINLFDEKNIDLVDLENEFTSLATYWPCLSFLRFTVGKKPESLPGTNAPDGKLPGIDWYDSVEKLFAQNYWLKNFRTSDG